MSQLYALLYKNVKIASRQWISTFFQFASPLMCIICVLLLQIIAKAQSGLHPIKPPIDIPFNGFYPINLPYSLIENRSWGSFACMKINKYAFTDRSDPESINFVNDFLGFQKVTGIRKEVCKPREHKALISPFFNQTDLKTPDQISDSILNDMERFYGTSLDKLSSVDIPIDGYYLFDKANQTKITGTLFSNNMNVQFYHRANMQTQVVFNKFAVK